MEIGDIEGVKNMTYWEFSAAMTIRNKWHEDENSPVEPPDEETFERAQAMILANPALLN